MVSLNSQSEERWASHATVVFAFMIFSFLGSNLPSLNDFFMYHVHYSKTMFGDVVKQNYDSKCSVRMQRNNQILSVLWICYKKASILKNA